MTEQRDPAAVNVPNYPPCTCERPNGFRYLNSAPTLSTQTWLHLACGGAVERPLYPRLNVNRTK